MKRVAESTLVLLALFAIFGGMQYWAVTARARDWWWFSGGSNDMLFADMHDAGNGKGHILFVERRQENSPEMTEFKVFWRCFPKKISWGDAWTLTEDMEQRERQPAPSEKSEWHTPSESPEQDFLRLACSSTQERARLPVLHSKVAPFEMTRTAFELYAQGVQPHEALLRAAAYPHTSSPPSSVP